MNSDKKILIVEDDELMIKILKFIINHALLMIWSLFVEQKTHLRTYNYS